MAPTTRQQSLQQKEKGPQPFPLFKLPPELRLRIYRAILKRPRPLRLQKPLPVLEPAPETETDAYGRQYTIIHDTASYIQQRITLARIKESRAEINNDAIDPTVLRLCKLLYFECRPILYSENTFTLQMDTATTTLTSLHQRNRSLIRHVELFIPTHHDILDQFTDIVRLGLRYCWGLKTFVITLPLLFPEDEPRSRPATRSVYANAFTILRWLPRATEVRLEGVMHEDIGRVVQEQQASREMLDEWWQNRQRSFRCQPDGDCGRVNPIADNLNNTPSSPTATCFNSGTASSGKIQLSPKLSKKLHQRLAEAFFSQR